MWFWVLANARFVLGRVQQGGKAHISSEMLRGGNGCVFTVNSTLDGKLEVNGAPAAEFRHEDLTGGVVAFAHVPDTDGAKEVAGFEFSASCQGEASANMFFPVAVLDVMRGAVPQVMSRWPSRVVSALQPVPPVPAMQASLVLWPPPPHPWGRSPFRRTPPHSLSPPPSPPHSPSLPRRIIWFARFLS